MRISLWFLAGMMVVALTQAAGQGIRPAVFAGQFYTADPARLAAEIESYLAAAAPAAPPAGKIIAFIVPHAGYVYSGRTAAAAYALVRGRAIDTVVIIGPSHHADFEGCSIWPDGGFETPLGIARVDAALSNEITEASGFRFRAEAFTEEHSVEVQVPFVQKALPGAAIVPIVMGRQTASTIRTLAAALGKTCLSKNVLVVASTDLSHFLPKAEAQATDAATAALIRAMDTGALIRKIEAGENFMCGGGPVAAVLLLAGKAGQPRAEILAQTDSSGFGGPIVGYLAAVILSGKPGRGPTKTGTGKPGPEEGSGYSLTPEEKSGLLRLARASVTEFVERRTVVEDATGKTKFLEPRGVFVTLTKDGELRGCIGFIEPVASLGQAVIRAAIYAATEDPRFPPVRPAELKDLKFEISVLTPVREIFDPGEVTVGRHGLIVARDGLKGVLLPQVPVENKWDRKTFLEQGSLKAGLPRDAWRSGAKLYVFEAIVFHE
ncbi:MAG: AmmeMemoRadiSam system protein B [Candidatus Aminicenantes bacterium]|nr:AmmeMemoRadiSam system protein B [Candidatus Aminicenantes bacterium]